MTTRADFVAALGAAALATSAATAATPAPTPAAAERALIGTWFGTLRRGGDATPFGLGFSIAKNGKLLVTLWNPAIHAYGVPFAYVAVRGDAVEIAGLASLRRTARDALAGRAAGVDATLALRRIAAPPALAEPTHAAAALGPPATWTYQAAPLWAAPLVAHDAVYATDAAGTVHAVSAHDGTRIWTYDAGAPLFGRVCAGGDALLVLDDAGTLHRIDAATGAALWRTRLAEPAATPRDIPSPKSAGWDYRSASPVVTGGIVYAGTVDGVMHARAARTGEPVWTYRSRGPIRASAYVDDDRVIFSNRAGDVVALHRANGRELWRRDTHAPVVMEPVAFGDSVIIGSRSSALLALARDTGAVRWNRFYFASWVESAPLIANGTGYIGSSDLRTVRAFDPASGRTQWETDVYGWTWGTPAVVNGVVYVASASGTPYIQAIGSGIGALDAATGAWRWRTAETAPPNAPFPLGYASGPVQLSRDAIVVAGLDGRLRAFPA